ncbi:MULTISPECIES: hypothetical protein [unclassified Ensifer]|uniref:hypothetical protein n=1 Tax=unclassified Ensifer TaxID=2633371 RepID=UPI00081357D3|nr:MULTISPECIES: hypothetical protein [unclassified Ensifer]OCP07958.1 hypothetical protein BC362_10130 [Ensifer sp. LC14]OCP10932.1 hypothetical protein BC374_17835 [Ensifer sp. LC13]OCP11525.1 hypothetical protein BBX50_18025 [Ensifer sp. LC11]OCP33341.1 hypothetical protein BC364_16910 [Ensifer sp. LC499]
MKKEDIDRLRAEYPYYVSDDLLSVPDGWIGPLETFLKKLRTIAWPEDHDKVLVALQWQVGTNGIMVYVTPVLGIKKWDPLMAIALLEIVDDLRGETQTTCRVCGSRDAWLRNYGPKEGVFCDEHVPGGADAS